MGKMHSLNRNKIYVVKDAEPVDIFCEVCLYVARDQKDLESIQKERACTECTQNFKYLDLDAWNRGERPGVKIARSKMITDIGDIK